jgi:hypothetical protein
MGGRAARGRRGVVRRPLPQVTLSLQPVTFREACTFIDEHHRHHRPPSGYKFGIGATDDGQLVGVATVGRPVSRVLDDGLTAEVTRLCTLGGENVCSMLYGACARAAKAMGFTRIITYTLESEPGVSLRASGWELDAVIRGHSWNAKSRPREDKAPLDDKKRWIRRLAA